MDASGGHTESSTMREAPIGLRGSQPAQQQRASQGSHGPAAAQEQGEEPPMPGPAAAAAAVAAEAAEPSQHLSTPALLFWVMVAAAQPVCVSMIGVLVRYLEVVATPPVPPLRVTCLIIIFALPVMLLVHALPLWMRMWWRRRREGRPGSAAADRRAKKGAGDSSVVSGGSRAALGAVDEGTLEKDCEPAAAPSTCSGSPGVPSAMAVAGLARVPTLPGLSRVYDRHPRIHRRLVLLLVSGCYLGVIVLLNTAPKLLDPAVIMLVTMFTVVGVALVGRLGMGVPLPRALAPAATLMIGGSAMVLVPDIKDGAGEAGSLTSVQAWLGFVAAVGALIFTVLFITLTQAFKRANLGAMEVLYWIAGLCAIFVLPVSLGVEGTDWAAQFRGFDASAWGALLFSACVGHVGAGPLLQYATWKLGGNTASLFFGLRLIVSVVASKLILGATVIKSGLQVAGAVLIVLSITGYMVIQWWAGRSQQRQLKATRCTA